MNAFTECFHEMVLHKSLLINAGVPIPLERLNIFWRTLSVPWPVVSNLVLDDDDDDDDDVDDHDDDDDTREFENGVRQFQSVFGKETSFVKKNMLHKLKGIYQPESVDTRQPVVQENTRGRPSAKDKNSKATKVPDLNEVPIVDHRISTNSRSTKVPNLRQEPPRHSSYTGDSLRHKLYVGDTVSNGFIEAIPRIYRPYLISIHNVGGDGNCGFRCVAHIIFQNENRWAEARHMLLQELDYHRQTYINMWGQQDFGFLWHTIDWFNGGAPDGHWMVMPMTGLVIASMINRPIVFISERGWNTCFPLLSGPNNTQGIDPLVIARVGESSCAHYILPTLDPTFPLPRNHPQWRFFREPIADGWITLYQHRLMQ
jgi:hypothetical protein